MASTFRKKILPFIIYISFFVGCILVWQWINHSRDEAGAHAPLRKVLTWNEKINKWLFGAKATSPVYDSTKAPKFPRVNGLIGLEKPPDTNWRLHIMMPGTHEVRSFTLAQIKALPRTSETFKFKCIEGWSEITWATGVRFSDFCKYYHIPTDSAYAGLCTPDSAYYVGIDMKSMLHPQTILCYQMSGKDLPADQGYPLRLIIPIKYGIKNIKRIGNIYFSNKKPRDYWYERGYDYDAAL